MLLLNIPWYAYMWYSFWPAYYQDKELEKKYAPFSREDYDKISLIKRFPIWLLMFPKLILALCIIIVGATIFTIIMIGHKKGTRVHPFIRFIILFLGRKFVRVVLFTFGCISISVERPEIDYS